MAETNRFPDPEIKTYHRGQLEELIGPITTQYAPQLVNLNCTAIFGPDQGQDPECPETLPNIEVKFDWKKAGGNLVGGQRCFTYIYPLKTRVQSTGASCAPLTKPACLGGGSGQCTELLPPPDLIPVTVDFYILDKDGRPSNHLSCVITPPC
jgi:hypothetical protein